MPFKTHFKCPHLNVVLDSNRYRFRLGDNHFCWIKHALAVNKMPPWPCDVIVPHIFACMPCFKKSRTSVRLSRLYFRKSPGCLLEKHLCFVALLLFNYSLRFGCLASSVIIKTRVFLITIAISQVLSSRNRKMWLKKPPCHLHFPSNTSCRQCLAGQVWLKKPGGGFF